MRSDAVRRPSLSEERAPKTTFLTKGRYAVRTAVWLPQPCVRPLRHVASLLKAAKAKELVRCEGHPLAQSRLH
jgi:hypothetical protein